MKFLTSVSLAVALACCVDSLLAQTTTATSSPNFNNVGSSGEIFEKIGVGARAAGMGGAFSALADDITSLYWNPAGVARLKGITVGASYTKWFADVTHNFIGAVLPLTDRYRLGVSLIVVD